MKKLLSTGREKKILILSCLVILLFVFYRGIYIPLSNASKNLEDKIFILEKQLTKNQHTLTQNQPYEQDYSQALDCYIQNKSDKELLNALSEELRDIADQKELKINDILVLQSKTTSTSNDFSINLSIHGKLENILEFLHSLQSCPHLFAVNEMILEKPTKTTPQIQCRLLLKRSFIK